MAVASAPKTLWAAATVNTNDTSATLECAGSRTIGVALLAGATGGTYNIQVSLDGTNWRTHSLGDVVLAANASWAHAFDSVFSHVRVLAKTATSGVITAQAAFVA
jgi:hypothetical protein